MQPCILSVGLFSVRRWCRPCVLKVKPNLLFLSKLFLGEGLCASDPMRVRSITENIIYRSVHSVHFRCNPTLSPQQSSRNPPIPPPPLRILLQRPKLPSRVPGLTGIYWSWHEPADYHMFYDSLDGSFITLAAASGFWWWTQWSQSRRGRGRGRGGEE